MLQKDQPREGIETNRTRRRWEVPSLALQKDQPREGIETGVGCRLAGEAGNVGLQKDQPREGIETMSFGVLSTETTPMLQKDQPREGIETFNRLRRQADKAEYSCKKISLERGLKLVQTQLLDLGDLPGVAKRSASRGD